MDPILAGVITAVIGFVSTLLTLIFRRLGEVHTVVNSNFSKALARIDVLEKLLTEDDIPLPDKPKVAAPPPRPTKGS